MRRGPDRPVSAKRRQLTAKPRQAPPVVAGTGHGRPQPDRARRRRPDPDGLAEMGGLHHRREGRLDRALRIGEERRDTGERLVILGIEDMEDRADEQRERGQGQQECQEQAGQFQIGFQIN